EPKIGVQCEFSKSRRHHVRKQKYDDGQRESDEQRQRRCAARRYEHFASRAGPVGEAVYTGYQTNQSPLDLFSMFFKTLDYGIDKGPSNTSIFIKCGIKNCNAHANRFLRCEKYR